jgi:hypothetical protein
VPGRDHLSVDLVRPSGVIAQRVDGGREILAPYRRKRLAGVEAFEFDQLVGVVFQQLGEPAEDETAIGRPHAAPGAFEGLSRRAHRAGDVIAIGLGDHRDDLRRGRVEDLQEASGQGFGRLAIDQQRFSLQLDRRTR